jgi:hypothetical protein
VSKRAPFETPPCEGATQCKQIKDTSCGWCINDGQGEALYGDKSGPKGTGLSCQTWIWDHSDCPSS